MEFSSLEFSCRTLWQSQLNVTNKKCPERADGEKSTIVKRVPRIGSVWLAFRVFFPPDHAPSVCHTGHWHWNKFNLILITNQNKQSASIACLPHTLSWAVIFVSPLPLAQLSAEHRWTCLCSSSLSLSLFSRHPLHVRAGHIRDGSRKG